ncbi:hypothetical protein [Pseudomonas lini]
MITINVNITIQIPEVQTVLRLPTPPAKQSAPKEEDGTEYLQHRLRIATKIEQLFGSEAATQYLAGTI